MKRFIEDYCIYNLFWAIPLSLIVSVIHNGYLLSIYIWLFYLGTLEYGWIDTRVSRYVKKKKKRLQVNDTTPLYDVGRIAFDIDEWEYADIKRLCDKDVIRYQVPVSDADYWKFLVDLTDGEIGNLLIYDKLGKFPKY